MADEPKDLVQIEKLSKPYSQMVTSYNAMRRVNTKINKKQAEYYHSMSKKAEEEVEENASKYPINNIQETIEMKFYNHNAEELTDEGEATQG
jgi:vacuolar-type H+-ATPase subunit C/Vma6